MKVDPWLLVAPGQLSAGEAVTLDDRESRHVVASLRRRPGDMVVVTDGAGTVASGRVSEVGKRNVVVSISSLERVRREPPAALTLALAVLHGQAMDWAVQKAVELGVDRLVPLISERGQVGLRVARGRTEHWQRAARQTLKQCHRAWALKVDQAVRLDDFVTDGGEAAGYVADHAGEPIGADSVPENPVLLVGPEGGLAARERELLARYKWRRLRLGRFVLRAETAAVVGAALLIAEGERAGAAPPDRPRTPGG